MNTRKQLLTTLREKISRDWGQKRSLLFAVVLVLIPSLAAILVAPEFQDAELRKVLYTGAGTLFFGGLLGGTLKLLLDDVVASKRRREDAATFVGNVLADLKSVYDRVARARILIPAHQSVKTYGEEMRDMIDARVQLRNVVRALEKRAEGINERTRAEVTRHVREMEKYLELLTSEFQDQYKALADGQRGYEERAKVELKRFAESKEETLQSLPDFLWKRIADLPNLSDFIGKGTAYRQEFEKPLDDASEHLRGELASILGHRRAARSAEPPHGYQHAAAGP